MADIPEMIGKYKIVSLVAKGGMGHVYKAFHPTLKRHVIIKKLTIRGNTSVVERFKREAQILLDCNDPHIVHLFDYFKEGSSHYLVLEYVDGVSLDVLLRKRRYLSGELSLYIFLDACRALKYAHDHGVIHRDIKPGNILISRNGDVKLADFGIASTEDDGESALTKEGTMLGTPSYMPPEQFENSKNVDKRADIYSMGVMLYEMVTGKKPFPGNFAPDTIAAIQKGRFVQAKRINPDLPPVVSALIRKMIRPNPRKRFKDMGIAVKIIEKYLKRFRPGVLRQSLVDCLTVPNWEESQYRPRTKKRAVFFTVAAILSTAAAAGYFGWTGGHVQRYLMPASFGPLHVSVRMPASIKAADDIFLMARLFVNDRLEMPPADAKALVFALTESGGKDASITFNSNTLYLKPGQYRLKLYAEQRIYWHSFTLSSFGDLGESSAEGNVISIGFDDISPRQMDVRTEAFDAISGKNISAATAYRVLDGNHWVLLEDMGEGRLVTGSVRKFRAESQGYYSELFSLKIAPYQDELRLRANLVPLPAGLTISAPPGRLRLSLNGSQRVILGGHDMPEGSLAGFRGGELNLSLPSGRYALEAGSGLKAARIEFVLAGDQPVKISISEADGVLHIKKE